MHGTDRHWRRLITVAATAALLAGACGGDTFDEGALGGTATEIATALPTVTGGTTVTQAATTVPLVAPTPIATSTPAPTATPTARTTAVDYTVASGDVLGIIAERFDISLSALQAANPGVSATSLQVGQTLTIPPPDGTVTGTVSLTPTAVPTQGPTQTPIPQRDRTDGVVEQYTVAAGDVASNIATAYGISLDALAGANGVSNIDALFVGQCLIIPPVGSTTSGVIASTGSLCPGSTPGTGTAATATPDPNATAVPTATPDPNATAVPTATPDPNATATATATATPEATATAGPSPTPTPTPLGIITETPVPTATPIGGSVVTATPTPTTGDPTIVAAGPGTAYPTAADCLLAGGVPLNNGFACDLP